jgi:predicted O-methyltransferase YrrM
MSKYIEDFYSGDIKYDENGGSHSLSLSSVKKDECYSIYEIVKKYKPVKTLEIGFALGASSVGIIAGKLENEIDSQHIVLDPFQRNSFNVGLKSLEAAGLDSYFMHLEKFSENYLNEAYQRNETFDFIFIDGNHSIGQAVTDAFLADKILNPGGIIGIHDSLLFSTAASIRYLLTDVGYKIVSDKNHDIRNIGRRFKYIRQLGLWYCFNVVSRINSSIIFLQKN